MKLYSYSGPVMEFDTMIESNWKGKTQAVSADKARSNLTYQFKVKNNRLPNAKIFLPGEITEVQ